MSKRAPQFIRRKHDAYDTPFAAIPALLPHLKPMTFYAEPCVGSGALVEHLARHGHTCVFSCDIQQGLDAMDLRPEHTRTAEAVITNPPWTRQLLHPMIKHFVTLAPEVWLLFDGDWLFTAQAKPYIDLYLTDVVPTRRLKWIPDSPHTAKDNTAWYRFTADGTEPARFHGRK